MHSILSLIRFKIFLYFLGYYAIITIFDKTFQRRNQQRVKKDQILAAIQMCNLLDTDISNPKKVAFSTKNAHTPLFSNGKMFHVLFYYFSTLIVHQQNLVRLKQVQG